MSSSPRPPPCLTLVVLSTTDSLLATAMGRKLSIWGYLTAHSLGKAQEGSQDGICLMWGPSSRAVGSVCVSLPLQGIMLAVSPPWSLWWGHGRLQHSNGCRSGWQCCSHLHVLYLWLSLNFQSLLQLSSLQHANPALFKDMARARAGEAVPREVWSGKVW